MLDMPNSNRRYILAKREEDGRDKGFSLSVYEVYEVERIVGYVPSKKDLSELAQKCIDAGIVCDEESLVNLKEKLRLSEVGAENEIYEKPVNDNELEEFFNLIRLKSHPK